MEKTNERKLIEDLVEYIKFQLEIHPSSEWGKGCIDGFKFILKEIEFLSELHNVDLEESK